MQIIDAEPGSLDWYRARMGKITASQFNKVMTPARQKLSEQRHAYACRLIAERILNWQSDSIEHLEHVANGKAREPDALRQLQFAHDLEVRRGAFVLADDPRIGGSPDGFVVGSDNPVEVKCPSEPIHLGYLLLDHEAYKAQRQGHLYLCEKDEAIFFSYHPRMPHSFVRTHRDEKFIKALSEALVQFADEVDALEQRARALGVFQPYTLQVPVEKEEADNIRAAQLTDDELTALLEGRTGGRTQWGG